MSHNSYDVAVVGAGPAGSTVAFCLVARGMRVVVLEKASLPRYKTCGGGLVQRALQLFPMDIQSAVEKSCCAAELHVRRTGLSFFVRREKPIIWMTMRDRLDFIALSAAEQAGAEVYSSCEVMDVRPQNSRVELVTTHGSMTVGFVVAADGASSAVARKVGWREDRHLAPALECEVVVDDAHFKTLSDKARFDFDVVPDGYAWVFPKKEHLSIGLLSTKRIAANGGLHRFLGQYLRVLGIERPRRIERHGYFIPLSPHKGTFVRSRVLLVGDAAGFADPVTAEGISFAVQSARIAAEALLEGELEANRVREAYDGEIGKRILPELRYGRLLSTLLYRDRRVRAWLFQSYGTKLVEAVTDVFMGKRTFREIFQDPRSYLKLLKLPIRRHRDTVAD